jgi:hypothetical protein
MKPRETNHSSRTRLRFNWGYQDGWRMRKACRFLGERPTIDPERARDRTYRKAWEMGGEDAQQPLDLERAWRKFIDK